MVATDHGCGQLTDQVRILPECLAHPPPAQVAGDAQHRRERPVDAGRRHLHRAHARDLFGQTKIPGAGHAQLGREDRGALPERMPVDAVLADQQRNTQPGLLDLLLGGHQAEQVCHPIGDGGVGVMEVGDWGHVESLPPPVGTEHCSRATAHEAVYETERSHPK